MKLVCRVGQIRTLVYRTIQVVMLVRDWVGGVLWIRVRYCMRWTLWILADCGACIWGLQMNDGRQVHKAIMQG